MCHRIASDVPPSNLTADQLLDGLLTAEFGSRSCRSRYEFASYHDNNKKKGHPSHKPSPYLLAKLRRHEALQRRCGPGTAPHRAAIRQLKSGNGDVAADADGCRYLVSISYQGLGNRMLATASAFLYAVLTERALLIEHDLGTLFCEPFPNTTWLLPSPGWFGWVSGFPLAHLRGYDSDSRESLGNMLKNNVLSVGGADGNASWSDSGRRPSYVYLHLEGRYGFHDKLFYCDEHQRLLRGAPWLLMKTDSYLVPGLFLVPSFQDELGRMFPEKDAAFHHLGRYLFHPVNDVWRAVTRYHAAHLASAGQRVGIQIRVFWKKQELQHVLDQVLSCVRREKLLADPHANSNASAVDQAVLVTSLSSWYYERIRDEYGGAGGIRVHQPSHEGRQKWGDASHDGRALSEMYMLSTCDVLVTTGFSTFGYIAQGLGGVRPWIMPATPIWSPDTGEVPDPPCMRAISVEPCFHSPSYYDCAARKDVDVGKVVPYVQTCEDVSWGIKIANDSSQW
jgi:xyloglucan fucosyltransferase